LRAKLKFAGQPFRPAWIVVLLVALALPAAAQTSSPQSAQKLSLGVAQRPGSALKAAQRRFDSVNASYILGLAEPGPKAETLH
jgi:hypothetical protein